MSHESLEVQGIRDREPTLHLSRSDWAKEKSGIRTTAGDKKRAIKERNDERNRKRSQNLERSVEMELSR